MADLVRKIALDAGICWDLEHVETMDRIGGRGITANSESMYQFARLIGKMAREDERRKHERSNETRGSDHGG